MISKGLDDSKDQSYVLWGLKQEVLKRTLFPVGGYRKTEIRKMAADMGFEELSKKSESYEICFIPDNDYRSFLKNRKPETVAQLEGGNFVSASGRILGKHRGYPFYTIGQRKGLEIAFGEPMYVTAIDPQTNTVVLGTADELKRTRMKVRNVNLIKFPAIKEPMDAVIKIRYKDKGTAGTVVVNEGIADVEFHAPVSAIAPGQSAVFYDDNDVIGGGFIVKENFSMS